ncbi:tRNA uridine-5-carboxymethylaminomethyl(34) synthesis GTPase MnmE [Emticicia sp. 21SJ11W-3]|uniref:tRNA uridine-5-carboxymethylaminomethyl(34) synthesis GTPase MnmE n=1 Tax=Emticicia sp. 21SJ11W-3 TaxID=2916755 RepID=UPI0020A082BC|nr:tRNA uridine-5-carboxymethylaminomethyl(34) synthesis GTPase MnmE [Emticicia sp. 21SJ11W-3]UTA68951.1 tRNA uridine-5-carboxymethylaminomethyl(34) synthesis GTPase MnmE [Emticicia sp. 21SJ11W-3]
MVQSDTICALATPQGIGAIGVIRVSGERTFEIVNKVFKGKDLMKVESHTIHFGTIRDYTDAPEGKIIDEVLVSVFKNPRSFTKEDVIEISCHGSDYIIKYILKLLIQNGCRMAKPGEFTQRAFLNGQFDLVQAEAVADLIAADSEAAHKTALNQMRGGFSTQLKALREELVHFASLVELELDFGEEDVEFAGRDDLRQLILKIQNFLKKLINSFDSGNVIKEGIPVAIIGPPNAGKSTLLNALLNEEKAIVTDIAGTTRDVIEDILFIGGTKFRIIDTAGIRETKDVVESIGIERSKQALEKAEIAIMLFENEPDRQFLADTFADMLTGKATIWVRNKIDLVNDESSAMVAASTPLHEGGESEENASPIKKGLGELTGSQVYINISAKNNTGIDALKNTLADQTKLKKQADTMLTNLRHYEHLAKAHEALDEVLKGLRLGITGDFLAQDIRLSLYHLGEITGQITTDDLLANIFSKFCIGK